LTFKEYTEIEDKIVKRRLFLQWFACGFLAQNLLNLLALNFLYAAETTINLYVSPDGDDRNSGTIKAPFATIEAARNAIRKIKQERGNNLQNNITVFLREGTYQLDRPLIFTSEDSGTKNYPITYKAYRGEKPIISGGKTLSNWQKITLNGKKLWSLNLPEVKNGNWHFRQLWFDGELRRRARYPHQGYLSVEQTEPITADTPLSAGKDYIRFRQGDLRAWQTIDRAELVLLNYWAESRLPVVKLDSENRTIHATKPSVFRLEDGKSESSGAAIYYIENALEILEYPKEWFLDNKLGILYYLPAANEEPEQVNVTAPFLSQIVKLQGDSTKKQLVESIHFEGITFSHTNWDYPKDSQLSGYGQAAARIPGAIYCEGVANCSWNNCTIAHIDNYGIEFSDTCYSNRIIKCNIFDLGAGGIKIAANLYTEGVKIHQSKDNIISNCHIYNGGNIFHGAVGIWLAHTDNNRVYRNNIHHFYYSGISIGWTWGYTGLTSERNKIEYNHIHHLGKKDGESISLLNDKGAIYTLGKQPKTSIRNNLIHDIEAFNYGAWGIYLDEGSSDITVAQNLIYRTLSGGFHLNFGKDNLVINNIFALNKVAQIRRSSGENHRSLILTKNIIFWREGELAQGEWNESQTKCDRNLYWNAGTGTINFGQWSWQQWQAKGEDLKSTIADPLFFNPDRDDFTLDRYSPAWKLGFRRLIF
jgi:hypothetical protein